MTEVTQELRDIFGTFAGKKHPMQLSASGIITDKQVKAPMCFLVACQHQAFG